MTNAKIKIQITLLLAISSAVMIIAGVLLYFFTCQGECGSTMHGGCLTLVCPRAYILEKDILIIIAIGTVGLLATLGFIFGRRKPQSSSIGWFSKQLDENIKKLSGENYQPLPWIFCVFTEGDDKAKQKAVKVLTATLNPLSFNKIIRLDDQMRHTSSVGWNINWRDFKITDFFTSSMTPSECHTITILASFHANGFLREKAVKMMKNLDGTLPYIILRLNDWVDQVRQAADSSFKYRLQHLSEGEIFSSLPFMEKLTRSSRVSHSEYIHKFFVTLNAPEYFSDLVAGLQDENVRIRRICIEALFNQQCRRIDLAVDHLTSEADPFLRVLIFKNLQVLGQKMEQVSKIFLSDKHPNNRLLAFNYLLETKVKDVYETAEKLLLDKNTSIRCYAQNIIAGQFPHFDFRKFYLQNLDLDTASAISGLGEKGWQNDTLQIENYLNDKRIAIVKVTMMALIRLDKERYISLIVDMLNDSRIGIVKTARNILLKTGTLNYQRIFDIFYSTQFEHSKLKCIDILFAAPKWTSLIYMLKVMLENDQYLKDKTIMALKRWLLNFNRSFLRPNVTEVNEIQSLIEQLGADLPVDIKKNILFVL